MKDIRDTVRKILSLPIIPVLIIYFAFHLSDRYVERQRSIFLEDTRQQMVEQVRVEYEASVDEAFEELKQQYRKDLETYEQAQADYDQAVREYEEEEEIFSREKDAYLQDYQKELDQYNEDLKARAEALEARNEAYQKAYEQARQEAETARLRNGIDFSVSMTFESSDKNHVGNNWSNVCTVNGVRYFYGMTVRLRLGGTVGVSATMTEQDNYPDVGSGYGYGTVTREWFASEQSISVNVSVREDRGRYAGNVAQFRLKFTFTPLPEETPESDTETDKITVDVSSLPKVPPLPKKPPYSPPELNAVRPDPPAVLKPIEPVRTDVTLEPPLYDSIQPTEEDMLLLHPEFNGQTSVSRLACGIVFVVCVFRLLVWFRAYMQKESSRITAKMILDEKEKQESEARYLEIKRREFFNLQGMPGPKPMPPLLQTYGCEEEKRLNYRLWQLRALFQELDLLTEYETFIAEKILCEYLEKDREMLRNIQQLWLTVKEHQKTVQQKIDSFPNPLHELSAVVAHPSLSCLRPEFENLFSTSTNVSILKKFFASSDAVYFGETESESPIILTGCFAMKFDPINTRFTLITLDNIRITAKPGQITTCSEPEARDQVDVLETKWKHMTKDGKRDRRFRDNPCRCILYQETVSFGIGDTKVATTYLKKDTAAQAKQEILDYCQKWGPQNPQVRAVLNLPCRDPLPTVSFDLPPFPTGTQEATTNR